MSDAAGVAQPSTPKLDLPTKLSAKSSARVVVAKTDTTAHEASGQTPSDSTQPGAPAKPEKAAKKPKPAQTTADATETPANPAAPPPVDATAATASGGWAVQLAAPKSEAEANSEMARLTGKYGADLNGSPLGVHKAVVNGQTIYRLRVVGLTKADAAALCARLKGDGGEWLHRPSERGAPSEDFCEAILRNPECAKSFICGCAGLALDGEERAFLRREDPWGLILFRAQCRRPRSGARVDQLSFRECVGPRRDAPRSDRPGGRPGPENGASPHWRAYPAAAAIEAGLEPARVEAAARLVARLIAHDPGGGRHHRRLCACARRRRAGNARGHRYCRRPSAHRPERVVAMGRAVAEGLPCWRRRAGRQAHAGSWAGRAVDSTS